MTDTEILLEDCREVSGVLAISVIDLLDKVPVPRQAPYLSITDATAHSVDGLDDY